MEMHKVWTQATSIVGSSQAAKAHAIQIPIDFDGTLVKPGDWVCSDSMNGVVVIPQKKLGDVVNMLPGLVGQDDRVREAVARGLGVGEAFKRFR